MTWLRLMFSDANGVPDEARVAAFLVVLTFCACSIWAQVTGHAWNPQEFGIGAGALAAGLGAWFGIRKDN